MSTTRPTSSHKRYRQGSTESQFAQPPLSDRNAWFYPSHAFFPSSDAPSLLSDEETTVDGEEKDGTTFCASTLGNWGRKTHRDARWVRRGKAAAWGPDMDEWEAENRARKRIKLLMESSNPPPPRPTTPTLSHLPPLPPSSPPTARMSRGLPPSYKHSSYSSFILDRSTTRAFRGKTFEELERSAGALIEGETAVRRALGRLWLVIGEKQRTAETRRRRIRQARNGRHERDGEASLMVNGTANGNGHGKENGMVDDGHRIKRETGSEEGDIDIDMDAQAPESPDDGADFSERSVLLRLFASSDAEATAVEKAMLALRSMQDDSREYVERLHEIRDGLGQVQAHRAGIWDEVRERGIQELKEQALASAE